MLTNFYTGIYRTMINPQDYTGENPLWSSKEPYFDSFYWYVITLDIALSNTRQSLGFVPISAPFPDYLRSVISDSDDSFADRYPKAFGLASGLPHVSLQRYRTRQV